MFLLVLAPLLLVCFEIGSARLWNDTGSGKIVLEEAWTIPELIGQISSNVPPVGQTNAELKANLLDIHNQRLASMDANGIDYMVLSCAQPCIQGLSDPEEAATMAINVNNQLAADISNNTLRFGGFASLAMHNATVAARELKRTVTELGFLGALINDYQQSGPDNETLLYYDQPEYDVFWQMVTDLNVPVYLHPRTNIAQIAALEYSHAIWLRGPAQEYAATLSTHILGLSVNGVFEYGPNSASIRDSADRTFYDRHSRFPKLKIIVGHMGERVTSDLVRIDDQLARQLVEGMPMKRNASSYWQTNLYETTSGNFATPLLDFHINQIGLERILFSVDYPYVSIEEGTTWVDGLSRSLRPKDLMRLKRETAIELLRLNER